MADSKKTAGKTGAKKKGTLIDPLYEKYTRSVIRALGSTDFYEFFMDAVSKAENTFQFSNRRMEKKVDLEWVDAIEESLPAIQNIVSNPRNMIHEEEIVVNVAQARKAGADVVRHLSQHASLVDKFDQRSGEVQPNKLMQKYREDSAGLYENRLVFTTLELAFQFVKIRHDAIFSAMSEEFGAKLRLDSTMETSAEYVHLDMFMHIRETDDAIKTDEKNEDVFARISKLYRVLGMLMQTQFSQQMEKLSRVKGSITKTNVLKKNPHYRKIVQLLEFLRNYTDIGYTIKIIEQNPEINETMERDIYHNILFNYLVLKGYLEDEKDRRVETSAKSKRRSLKPKFIKEIIEELTDDYDLPDVEIRKVLIEELTKEQLLAQEAEERRRIVEEQERRKKEEQERLRKEKEAEKERIRKEKEAEKERLRQEKEEEEKRLRLEQMEREAEDRRRCKIFSAEIALFAEKLGEKKSAREEAIAKRLEEIRAFEEAARIAEEKQRLIDEENERIRREAEAEQQRLETLRIEKELAEARRAEAVAGEIARFTEALPERISARETFVERFEKERNAFFEAEKLMQEAEQVKIDEETRRREERERIALEKQLAEESARAAEENERIARENERIQKEQDSALTKPYYDEVVVFTKSLQKRIAMREEENARIAAEKEMRELARKRRMAARAARG